MSESTTSLSVSSAPPPSTSVVATDPAAQRNILIAVLTALVAVIASVSGLNVAQTDLAVDLGASQNAVLWIINAYTIVLAALLLPIGAIGDRWGRKPVLVTGLIVFGVASVGAALAPSVAVMMVARVVAGVGAAMIMPVTLSVITSSFPPEDRARAIGIWAGLAGAGGIVSLFVSSFMVDVVTWRWLFIMPISLVLVSGYATARFVPNSREASTRRFDVGGSVLSALAIGGIVLGIHEGPERGWTDPLALAGLVTGVLCAIAFVVWERRQPDPLLDTSAFRDRGLASGSSTLLIVFAVMFGIFLVLFPYLQGVVGWSALQSATGLLPMAAMMMPTATIAPRIAARVGARLTMITGVSIFGVGLATLALRASVEGGYWSVLPGLMILGLGMGLTMTPATEAITATLPADKQGVASALNDTSRELGGAVGVALLGSILSAGYRSAIDPALDGVPPEIAEPAREGIGSALAVAAQAGSDAPRIIDAAQHAFVDGWVTSMWVGFAMAAVALGIVIVRGPRTSEATATDFSAGTDERAIQGAAAATIDCPTATELPATN